MDFKEIGEILGTRGDCQSCKNKGMRLWEVFVDGFRLEVCEKCLNLYREKSERDKNRREVNPELLAVQRSQKEVGEKAGKKDERSGKENIETMRSLKNCSKKLSEEIRKLRTSLEAVEKVQKELDNILSRE
jgi:ribosome-binding protein aMBF1 (putative translation factor)